MDNHIYTDQDIRQLEAHKLHMEIGRHEKWWKPSLLGVLVFLTLLASFADFFSNLYQISITERDILQRKAKALSDVNDMLSQQVELYKISISTLETRNFTPREVHKINESSLYGAVLIMRWGSELQDIIAIRLDPITRIDTSKTYAHGAVLGLDKSTSSLGRHGGTDWSGIWTLSGHVIRIVETCPRPLEKGLTLEVDLAKRSSNGQWVTTRKHEGMVEYGVADILFKDSALKQLTH